VNHLIAIESLHDELEEAERQCKHLSRGIANMMSERVQYPQKIREHALLRWRRSLDDEMHKVNSLKYTITFLENAMREGK
jgi:hypothetical protein